MNPAPATRVAEGSCVPGGLGVPCSRQVVFRRSQIDPSLWLQNVFSSRCEMPFCVRAAKHVVLKVRNVICIQQLTRPSHDLSQVKKT